MTDSLRVTVFSHASKQIGQAGPQPLGDLFDVDQREVPHATLNTTVIRSVEPTAFCSFFLANLLLLAHATDYSAKTDADIGRHSLQLSSPASDQYTADASHLNVPCSAFVTQTASFRRLFKKRQTSGSRSRQTAYLALRQTLSRHHLRARSGRFVRITVQKDAATRNQDI
jgi:hypothetical protein